MTICLNDSFHGNDYQMHKRQGSSRCWAGNSPLLVEPLDNLLFSVHQPSPGQLVGAKSQAGCEDSRPREQCLVPPPPGAAMGSLVSVVQLKVPSRRVSFERTVHATWNDHYLETD